MRKQVVKDHPFSRDDLQRPDRLEKSAVGQHLVQKLLQTPPDKLDELISGLSSIEREFLPVLIAHDELKVRRKCAQCFSIAPSLAREEQIWRSLCRFYSSYSSELLANLLAEVPDLQAKPGTLRRAVIDGRSDTPAEGAANFWKLAFELKLPFGQALDRAQIPDGCELALALNTSLLVDGSLALWEIHDTDELSDCFGRADLAAKVATFGNLREIYGNRAWQNPDEYVRLFFNILDGYSSLQSILEVDHIEVWKWCQQVLHALRLAEFFDADDDNERFEFWRTYLPKMKDVIGDVENSRIFIEFDGFGVVEFGDIGYAGYVYKTDYFREVVDKHQAKPHLGNRNFQNRDHAIDRLIHQHGWQTRFSGELAWYFRWYGNE
jgi:hypothetical protein